MEKRGQSRARILVVDDEEVVHASMNRVLGRAGYEVTSCYAARDALTSLTNERFDIAIVDLMMPEMNGIQFLEHSHEQGVAVPTIMVTGHPTIRTAMQALRLGAVDYVAKPFTRRELLAPVTRALFGEGASQSKAIRGRTSAEAVSLSPGDVLYLPNHSWARFEQTGVFLIGVEESFLSAVGLVTAIETAMADELVEQGTVGVVLTNDADEQHGVSLPLTGIVERRNDAALASPGATTSETWILQIRSSDLDNELDSLLLRGKGSDV